LDLTQVPPYAILSHRWTDDEITYKDFAKGRRKSSAGFRKIEQFCHWAGPPQRVQWIWVDTACIDQRSSAELSEAINSMYHWYREAAFCVAYLADITNFPTQEQLAESEWFERGWTLQELLAPDEVIFCSKTWREFGRKGRGQATISRITGIAPEYLHLPSTVKAANFAEILSWAAGRKTSRAEDMAYCLLGLLDINMPLLYGEGGQKAFMRLQYLFIQQSADESIFIFRDRDPPLNVTGMLAVEPAQFHHCISNDRSRRALQRAPYYVTHKGLYIEGP
ncbi:heterokaryon incompatibility protein-domain-containing protein, partial [Neohortaea acidophila]